MPFLLVCCVGGWHFVRYWRFDVTVIPFPFPRLLRNRLLDKIFAFSNNANDTHTRNRRRKSAPKTVTINRTKIEHCSIRYQYQKISERTKLHVRRVRKPVTVFCYRRRFLVCVSHWHKKMRPQRLTRYAAFPFPHSVTLAFDLLTSELLCRLLLTWITSPLSFNAVWFSVFEFTVGTGQTDERTDERMGCNS